MWKGRDKSEKLGATQLEVLPPRPKLRTEPCQIVFNSLKTIRLTWTWNWNWNHALIEKFEIFASVQRVKMAFATKWVKIGEIQVGQKSRKVEEVRRSNMKLAVSRRIAGVQKI